jgi:hypothetical protein
MNSNPELIVLLNPDFLVMIFSFLDLRELLKTNLVCHLWNDAANLDILWKSFCLNDWIITRIQSEKSFKEAYYQKYVTENLKPYKTCYSTIRTCWDRLETILAIKSPRILSTLSAGCTEKGK